MTSVTTGNQTRDDDLRSDNFFAAATYPVMTYRSTGIRHDGHGYVLDGELTVRGVTRPVSLRFEVNGFTTDSASGSTRAGFSASGEINRMYLLTGLMFAAFYAAFNALGGGHFFASGQPATTQTFQYFSFTTLTTLGYGDFTAAASSGRAVAMLEALTGQIFLVTLVARLVAGFRAPGE
jgi:hypothetical protein